MQSTVLKDAFWLMRFEVKHSVKAYLLLLAIYVFFVYVNWSSVPIFLDRPSMAADFHFMFALCFLPLIVKPKLFRAQRMNNYFSIVPFFVMGRQLPITIQTFITYKAIYHLIETTIITSLFLLALYPKFQAVISLGSYFAFIFIWLLLAYSIRILNVVSELGVHIILSIAISVVVVIIGMPLYIFLFFKTYEQGFLIWTLEMAEQYPLYSIVIGLLFVVIMHWLYSHSMKNKMNKKDIFV